MNIVFDKLIINNFLSFGYAELDLNISGYTLISGKNRSANDCALSNGSGKSTIGEAICWVLTGETIRGSKNVCNVLATDGAYVELLFRVDGIDYRILRSKEHSKYKTNLKIWVNEEDKSGKGIRDSEKILQGYLPDLTSSLIGSVIILGQGLPHRFSNNTPSGRKEVLEKLSKSDFMIEDVKNRVLSRKQNLSIEIRDCEDKILEINTKIAGKRSQLADYENQLANLTDLADIENHIESSKEKLANLEKSLSLQIEDRDRISKQIFDYDGTYREMLIKYQSAIDANNDKYAIQIDALTDELLKVSAKINLLKDTIADIQTIRDVCPTCGQKLVGVEKPDISSKVAELDELSLYHSKISSQRSKFIELCKDGRKEIEDKFKHNSSVYDSKSREFKSNLTEASNSVDYLNKEITRLTAYISECVFKKSAYNDNKLTLTSSISSIKEELEKLSSELLYNTNIRDNLNYRLDLVQKMERIATRDFRGFLLTTIIDYINNKAKEYSKYIFDSDKISFSLDGNNIDISYLGKQYENLSGGEKQKVDLIIQFSIRDMLCRFLNFSCNCIFLDELFDNLDSLGCEKVINLLSTKLTDISSTYIITHHSDISIPIDREILVIKDNKGISEIE